MRKREHALHTVLLIVARIYPGIRERSAPLPNFWLVGMSGVNLFNKEDAAQSFRAVLFTPILKCV